MGAELAVESDPTLAGSGTTGAWEETGIAGNISRRLSSFPELLDLRAAPLLDVSVACQVRARHPVVS